MLTMKNFSSGTVQCGSGIIFRIAAAGEYPYI